MKTIVKFGSASALAIILATQFSTIATAAEQPVAVVVTTTSPEGWETENTYWRQQYPSRPYYTSTRDYTLYEPAYRYGAELYTQYPGKRYEEIDMVKAQSGWIKMRGTSTLTWEDAQAATRDSYVRMYGNASRKGN